MGVVHAPLAQEGREVRRLAILHEVLGHIEADAARADDGDARPRRLPSREQIGIADDLRVIEPGDVGHARHDAAGEDDLVEALEVGRGGLRAKTQLHARLLHPHPEVAEHLVELLLARHALGEVDLTAQLRRGFEERDAVAAFGGVGREAHARRAAAHDDDPLGRVRLREIQLQLIGRAGVHEAGGALLFEDVIEAGLVAADAGVDVIRPVLGGLLHEVGVGEQRPRHAHHVRIAIGEDGFRHFRRVDAVRRDEGDSDFALQLVRHPGEGAPGHHRRDGRHAGLVPADAGVEDRRARGLHGLGELDDLVPGRSIRHQIQHGEPEDDDEVPAHGLAHGLHDLKRKAHAVRVAAAPFIRAAIGARDDEFVDEVAFAAHDLDAIVARLLRELGALGVVADRRAHAAGAQRAGLPGRDGRLHFRRRDGEGVIAVPAAVEDLQRDLASRRMDSLRHLAVLAHLPEPAQLRAEGREPPSQVRRDAARDDEPHAARRALCIEGRHLLEAAGLFFEPRVHGAHEHAILQRGEAEIQGFEQARVRHEELKHESRPLGRGDLG